MQRFYSFVCVSLLSSLPFLTAGPGKPVPEGYIALFDGESMKGWFTTQDNTQDIWKVNPGQGTLGREIRGGYIWTTGLYTDFILELEFKVSRGCNSGVFFRTDPSNPVQGGFEIQVYDHEGIDKHSTGALYDAQAPSSKPLKDRGDWNHLKLYVNGDHIKVWINGVLVNDIDLSQWDTPNQNPDGTENKFNTALRDLPKTGHIGFQDHGHNVWYRNIFLQQL